MDKLINGATLGPFRIIHQIGEGGMAKVYKAYQPSMERYVALKVLSSHFAEDPQFINRFNREARTIATLEHRNILPVYDYGEQKGITYMAMRYVEGGTLKELLNKGRLSMQDILDLMLQIGSALDYAHRRGVIHRDVKPSNVILDGEGAAYLMDFGIAKVLGKSGDLTATGAAIGTPAYMAPEQALGEKVDGRTDIYALGVMLYEMVVGRVPYQADTPMAVLMAHLHDPLPLPRVIDPSIPEPIEAVIIKSLAKNPEDRYQSANELTEAFRKALHDTAHHVEASTLITLIREVQTSRPVFPAGPATPSGGRAVAAVDPRVIERMERDYIDGLSAYWIRNWAKACAFFQAVLAVDPTYKDAASRLEEVEKQIHLADLYAQAQEAINKSDWRTAMEKLSQLVALDKEYQQSATLLKTIQLRVELAELYAQAEQLFQAGQWQAVVNIFHRMRALDPNTPDPKGLLNQAKASLAEQQRREKVAALYQRGLEALEGGRFKEALRLFEQVRAQQPGYGDVELLIQRVQDEMNRTRQRPALKPSKTEKAPAAKPPLEEAEVQAGAALPMPEMAEADVTIPASARGKVRRWIGTVLVWVMVLVVIGGIWAGVTGRLEGLANSLGLVRPTPLPSLPMITPVPTALPYLFDDFQKASITGMLDGERWEISEDCGAFSDYGRLVQDGVVRLINKPSPVSLLCQFFPQRGQRVPGIEVGALEARMNFVEQVAGGESIQSLSLLSDYENKSLQAFCGLRTTQDGHLLKFLGVKETKNNRTTELAYQDTDALFDHWYAVRLSLNPATMTFECQFDKEMLGRYQLENGDALRQAGFARFIENGRKPQSAARTLFDDVRLIPLGGAELWEQNKLIQESTLTSPSCPEIIRGWRAEFWDNWNLEGDPIKCFPVDHIYFTWEEGSPLPGAIPVDYFSARFIGAIEFPLGHYRFRLRSDDGARLWINDQLIIDQWHVSPFTTYTADLELPSGMHTLRLEYFEITGWSGVTLSWEKNPDRGWANATTCLAPAESLVGWWAGDGDGSNELPGIGLSLGKMVKFTPGMVGEAFSFEPGMEKGAELTAWTDLDTRIKNLQQLTLETWVKLAETQPGEQDQSLIDGQARVLDTFETIVSLGDKVGLQKDDDGRLHFYMEIDGVFHHIVSDNALPRGEFIHVAATYDGRWMRLYWNGKLVGALEVLGRVAGFNWMRLSSEERPLFGTLDEVSLYASPLSEVDIQSIYAAGRQGKCKKREFGLGNQSRQST